MREAINHRQSETVSLADRLGGEKGVEDFFQNVRRHTHTGIGDVDHHVLSRIKPAILRSGDPKTLCRDCKTPALWHGIPRVDCQVQQSAFELIGVCQGLSDVRRHTKFDGDRFWQCSCKQFLRRSELGCNVKGGCIKRLPARKGQKPGNQCGGPVCRFGGSVHEAAHILYTTGRDAAFGEIYSANDASQHVVEVVCDPARQLTDRLHLLRLSKRFFSTAARGHFFLQLRSALCDTPLEISIEIVKCLPLATQFRL